MIPILKKTRRWREAAAFMLLAAALGAACADPGVDDDRLHIVTTTSIVADLVSMVTGDAARVESLVPNGADIHDFEPSARDLADLASVDLVVAVGLGLEPPQLTDAFETATPEVVELGPLLDPIAFVDDPEVFDPHVWLDPRRMADAVDLIADRIDRLAPGVAQAGTARTELEDLDREVAEMTATVPAEQRKLITSHAVLGYFAHRYGFEVVGVIIGGGDTLSAPSSRDLAELIELGRSQGIAAVFVGAETRTEAARTVAAGLGPQVPVIPLLTESLGEPGSGTDSYVGMMRYNAEAIAVALGGESP